MTKSRDEKIQDLRVWIEDLEAMKADLPGNFPSSSLESLARAQIEHLKSTLLTSIDVHGLNQEQRIAREIRESRGHFD